jgi:hypothetical protein
MLDFWNIQIWNYSYLKIAQIKKLKFEKMFNFFKNFILEKKN